MKLFRLMKDGGPESRVWGYFAIEIKSLFSVVLLNFKNGSREAFHNHAFDAISWILKGHLSEQVLNGPKVDYKASMKPVLTSKKRFHKVTAIGDSWVISFRGPWSSTWSEYLPAFKRFVTLTHGRKVIPNVR